MIVDEASRHELHTGLAEVLGPERASTLMSYLPPGAGTDLATKSDLKEGLRALEDRIGSRFDIVEERIESACDRVRAELSLQMISQTRTMIITLVTVVVAIAAMALFKG